MNSTSAKMLSASGFFGWTGFSPVRFSLASRRVGDDPQERLYRERLGQVGHRMELLHPGRAHPHGGDDGRGDLYSPLLELAQHVPPTVVGKIDVQQQKIRPQRYGRLNSLGCQGGLAKLVSSAREVSGDHQADGWIVLDH